MGARLLVVLLAGVVAVLAGPRAAPADRGATLDGPSATRRGHEVTFTGRLDDHAYARVGIYLGSSVVAWTQTDERGFFVARPHLFHTGDYRARGSGLVSPPHAVRVVRPILRRGVAGAGVNTLVHRLDALGYAVESLDETRFTGAVRQSVYAFQKAQSLAVDGIVGPETRARLHEPRPVAPRHRAPRDHIEVDTERQLVLLVEGGQVDRVVNTSTAGIPGYHTPRGTFTIFRRVAGIDTSPLGQLYDPLYFHGGYALHGSTNVPPHPASHGCVRLPIWEAARLFTSVPHGEVVFVY